MPPADRGPSAAPWHRVAVIGSGIAGLSAAHFLSAHPNIDVTVYERDTVIGGRANTVDGAEHCARLFLDDYHVLHEILREIPVGDGRSVYDSLERLHRYSFSRYSGWVENGGLYPLVSPGLRFRERLDLVRAKRLSPLIAEQRFASSSNRYGTRKNFDRSTQLRILANAVRPRICSALPCPTDEGLLDPWTQLLRSRGVHFETGAEVTKLLPTATGTSVEVDGVERPCDSVLLTAFVSDALPLLELSGIDHTVRRLQHSHCKCYTIQLDPREPILEDPRIRQYSHEGISIIVQPGAARCTVLCTFSVSTADDHVLPRVRLFLGLRHRPIDIRFRMNRESREALFHATLVDPESSIDQMPGLHFAGSWLRHDYILDAGEGAAQASKAAAMRIVACAGAPVPVTR